jgi:hypothetical protein
MHAPTGASTALTHIVWDDALTSVDAGTSVCEVVANFGRFSTARAELTR